MRLILNNTLEDYRRFLAIRRLPIYRIGGCFAEFPDEYASRVLDVHAAAANNIDYEPSPFLFDYQCDISRIAIRKKKYAVFADCGLGKTMILIEFARHAAALGKRVLIVSPLMVCPQTVAESEKFYGLTIPIIPAAKLQDWLDGNGPQIAMTNYEAIREGLTPGKLGALILDESSLLKSHYGKFGRRLINLGRGLEYKLCLTGTPAPNDRIEFANHAVFLDVFRTTNAFLARYFINRGQTDARWEIKPHALRPFYRDLSHWCIFLSDPSVYGWKDNCESIPPIHEHIEQVDLTPEQRAAMRELTGSMFVKAAGGIGQRGKLAQIGKGMWKKRRIPTKKPGHISDSIASWPKESTIVWCRYNDEQEQVCDAIGDVANITGDTKYEERIELIDAFKSRQIRTLVSKGKILGFGLNLQVATRQIFSACQDSYEEYYQCVKRSNRIGSTLDLNVHLPVTEIEEPQMQNVLRKAGRVESDTREQELLFKECGHASESE